MNIEELKSEVIYTESVSRLFELSVDFTQQTANLNVELASASDGVAKAEIRGKIALYASLQNIISRRIDAVGALEKENERKELLINRQFRKAAEYVLTRETFERIRDLSLINYKTLKDQKNELKANKLE